MPKLFTEREKLNTYPNRPLMGFSDFVVEEMPQILTAIHKGEASGLDLSRGVNDAMKHLPYDKFGALVGQRYSIRDSGGIYHAADLAGIDLKMAEAALVAQNQELPSDLGKMVDAVSKATLQPAILTYEELIYLNPRHDRRLFMSGEVGQTEADFYDGHNQIEHGFKKVKAAVNEARTLVKHGENDAGAEKLTQGNKGMQDAIDLMKEYHANMSKDHFNTFRVYLGSHPIRNLVGPSGNFTPELPTNEMLTYGELLPDEYYQYLEAHRAYFPRSGRSEMAQARRAVQEGKTLTQICVEAGKPESLVKAILETSKKVSIFRNQHFAAVKINIPDAVEGRLKGTAGEDPGTFLVQRRENNRIRSL